MYHTYLCLLNDLKYLEYTLHSLDYNGKTMFVKKYKSEFTLEGIKFLAQVVEYKNGVKAVSKLYRKKGYGTEKKFFKIIDRAYEENKKFFLSRKPQLDISLKSFFTHIICLITMVLSCVCNFKYNTTLLSLIILICSVLLFYLTSHFALKDKLYYGTIELEEH